MAQNREVDLVFGKGLGNGYPISGVACTNSISEYVNNALPGSTFAGNSLACAAACGVIDFMHQQNLPEKAAKLEKVFRDYFSQPGFHPYGIKLDGTGALLSIGFQDPSFCQMQDIYLDILSKGVITSHTQKHLRVMPPLTIAPAEFARGLEIIGNSLGAFVANTKNR